MSRVEIRDYAMRIRHLLGYEDTDYISAPKLFDKLSILFSELGLDFDYRILPDNHEIFYNREEAYTDMSTGIIYIKESVMEEACRRKYKRGAFTLIHELGHYFLHYIPNGIRLTRVADDEDVPIYCDPEWQADTFSSEFMMPYCKCVELSSEEIRKAYHVSRKASEVRYNKIQDELSR